MQTGSHSSAKAPVITWRFFLIPFCLFLLLGVLDFTKRHQQVASEHLLELSLAFNDLQAGLQSFLTSRKTQGLSEVKASKATFEQQLKNLDAAHQFGSVQKAHFASLNKNWGLSKTKIDLILNNENQFVSFQNAINDAQEKNKTMQDAYKGIIDFLLENHFSSDKVAAVQRQPWVADRISLRLLWLQRPLAFSPKSLDLLKQEVTAFLSQSVPVLQTVLGEILPESEELQKLFASLSDSIKAYTASLEAVANTGDQLIELKLHEAVQNLGAEEVDTSLTAFLSKQSPAQALKSILFNPWLNRIVLWLAIALTLFGLWRIKQFFRNAHAQTESLLVSDEALIAEKDNLISEKEKQLKEKEQALQTYRDEYEAKISDLQRSLDSEQSDIQQALQESEQSKHALEQKLQGVETEILSLQQALKENEQTYLDKEQLAQQQIITLREQLDDREQLTQATEIEFAESVEQVERQQAFEQSQYQVQVLTEQVANLEKDKQSLQEMIDGANHKLLSMGNELTRISSLKEKEPALDVSAIEMYLQSLNEGDLRQSFVSEQSLLLGLSQKMNTTKSNMQQLVKALAISAQQTEFAVQQGANLNKQTAQQIHGAKLKSEALLTYIKQLSDGIDLEYAGSENQLEMPEKIKEILKLSQALDESVQKIEQTEISTSQTIFARLQSLSEKLYKISSRFKLAE